MTLGAILSFEDYDIFCSDTLTGLESSLVSFKKDAELTHHGKITLGVDDYGTPEKAVISIHAGRINSGPQSRFEGFVNASLRDDILDYFGYPGFFKLFQYAKELMQQNNYRYGNQVSEKQRDERIKITLKRYQFDEFIEVFGEKIYQGFMESTGIMLPSFHEVPVVAILLALNDLDWSFRQPFSLAYSPNQLLLGLYTCESSSRFRIEVPSEKLTVGGGPEATSITAWRCIGSGEEIANAYLSTEYGSQMQLSDGLSLTVNLLNALYDESKSSSDGPFCGYQVLVVHKNCPLRVDYFSRIGVTHIDELEPRSVEVGGNLLLKV